MYRFAGPVPCHRCQKLTHAAMVRSNVWEGDNLIVVEDIPAQICEQCQEQYYDTLTEDALRTLMYDGLKSATPKSVMKVPVYSLEAKYEFAEPIPCPSCQRPTQAAMVRTNVWQGDRLIIVEDIPAQMCEQCKEQYYDTLTQEALRALIQDDPKSATLKMVMEVPVYSLEGRIAEPRYSPPGAEEEEPDFANLD